MTQRPIVINIVATSNVDSVVAAINASLQQLQTQQSRVNNTTRASTAIFRSWGRALELAVLGTFGLNVGAAAIRSSILAVDDAARAAQVEQAFKGWADAGDKSSTLILNALQRASAGTVSNLDLMLSANRAFALDVAKTQEDLVTLLEIARDRSRLMGISVQQAFDDIVLGLGRASPRILDNLGIIVQLDDVYKQYAESLGRTVQSLTLAEQRTALTNAVLEQARATMDRSSLSTRTSAEDIAALRAEWANLRREIIQGYLPAIQRALASGIQLISWANQNNAAFLSLVAAAALLRTRLLGLHGVIATIGLAAISVGFDMWVEDARDASEVVDRFRRSLDDMRDSLGNLSPEDQQTALVNFKASINELASDIDRFVPKAGNFAERLTQAFKSVLLAPVDLRQASEAFQDAITGGFDVERARAMMREFVDTSVREMQISGSAARDLSRELFSQAGLLSGPHREAVLAAAGALQVYALRQANARKETSQITPAVGFLSASLDTLKDAIEEVDARWNDLLDIETAEERRLRAIAEALEVQILALERRNIQVAGGSSVIEEEIGKLEAQRDLYLTTANGLSTIKESLISLIKAYNEHIPTMEEWTQRMLANANAAVVAREDIFSAEDAVRALQSIMSSGLPPLVVTVELAGILAAIDSLIELERAAATVSPELQALGLTPTTHQLEALLAARSAIAAQQRAALSSELSRFPEPSDVERQAASFASTFSEGVANRMRDEAEDESERIRQEFYAGLLSGFLRGTPPELAQLGQSMIQLMMEEAIEGVPDLWNSFFDLFVKAGERSVTLADFEALMGSILRAADDGFKGMTPQLIGSMFDLVDQTEQVFARMKEAMINPIEEARRAIDQQIGDIESSINRLASTPLLEAEPFREASFQARQQIARMQLAINQFILSGAASSEEGKRQLEAMEEELRRVQLRAQNIDLERQLRIDPLEKQIEDLVRVAPLPFRAIVAAIQQAQTDLASLQKTATELEKIQITAEAEFSEVEAAIKAVEDLLAFNGSTIALNVVTTPIPAMQHGGFAVAGRPVLVGESGPELFVPSSSGLVIPTSGGLFFQPEIDLHIRNELDPSKMREFANAVAVMVLNLLTSESDKFGEMAAFPRTNVNVANFA